MRVTMRLIALVLAGCAAPAPSPAPTPAEFPAAPPDPPALAEAPAASPRLPAGRPRAAPPVKNRLYLTTDKPLYRSGETVWIRTWHLEGQGFEGAGTGGVRYELIGPRGDLVARKWVEQKAGDATNDLVIPTNAPGGAWTVRATHERVVTTRSIVVLGYEAPRLKKSLEFVRKAYAPGDTVAATLSVTDATGAPLADHALTALVRLDGEDLPRVEVTTNAAGEATVRFPLPGDMELGDGLLTVLVDESGVTESISRRIPIVLAGLDVTLYPEGGALVMDVPSRVYFAATQADGTPADVSGRVVDDWGQVLGGFRSFHHGLGRFEFTPRRDRAYWVEIEGRPTRTPLPTARDTGCVLRAHDDFASALPALRVDVTCAVAQEVTVAGSLRGRVLDTARLWVDAGRAATVYLTPEEPAVARAGGVARVTVYDFAFRPLAERVVMRNAHDQLRIEVKPGRETYGPRDEVTLDLTATDPSGAPVVADLAVAVADDRVIAYADDEQGDIVSRMLVEAELSGEVHEPRSYFAEPTGYALDLLMGTAGWRTFAEIPVIPPGSLTAHEVVFSVSNEPPSPDSPPPPSAEWAEAPPTPAFLEDVPRAPEATGLDARAGLGGESPGDVARSRYGNDDYGARGGNFSTLAEGGVAMIIGDPLILGELYEHQFDAVIKRNMSQIRYCYQRELSKRPGLGGDLKVKFVVAKDGSVSSAVTKASTLADPATEACINGRFLRFTFPEPRGGGVVIATYTFRFAPDRFSAGSFATVRVFPTPRPAHDATRTNFRDTVAWVPSVLTDAAGHATVRFPLSDAVTSFRATVEGVGGGRVGRGEAVFASTLPFNMAVTLPVAAVRGDTLKIPLTLTNDRDAPVTVRVAAALSAPARTVTLPARAGRTLFYDLVANETIPVSFSAVTDGLTDAFTRTLRVVDAGYPSVWSASGLLDGTAAYDVARVDRAEGGAEAWLKVYPNPLATLVDGLAGLLELPHGCFEQTSSSNYPNLLVMRYLEQEGVTDAALLARTRGYLDEGYKRLTSYEVPGGGYEWFGRAPAHEPLTAYGIAQFTDMRAVYAGVDDAMVRRTTRWLTGRQDGAGGWLASGAQSGFGQASKAVTDAYITWALVGAGTTTGLDAAIDAQAHLATDTKDPYLLALATNTLLRARPALGAEAAVRLAALQDSDGAWRGADHSITRSGGDNLVVETTALATRALLDDGHHPDAVAGAARWLMGHRDGFGRWGSTQATVLTLDALTRYAAAHPVLADGAAIVRVDGVEVGRVAWHPGDTAAPRLALPLTADRHAVTVTSLAGAPVPYSLAAAWRTRSPVSNPDAAVTVATFLSADRVDMGEPVRLTARIANRRATPQPMILARIGVPAGLSVQSWQLEELRTRGTVSFYETRDNEVIVYFDGLGPEEVRMVDLDLLATVPGTYVAPATRAYLYYDDDKVAWAPPIRVSVSGG